MRCAVVWAVVCVGCSAGDSGKTTPPDEAGGDGSVEDTAATDTGSASLCGPPDADPAPTANGHPTDGWRWQRHGPLFEDAVLYDGLTTVGYNRGALAPTLVDTGAGLHLIYMLQTDAGTGLFATTSTDGAAWSAPVAVTGLDGESYPSLVYDGGFSLWVGTGSVGLAESDDGIAFSAPETVLRAGDAGFDAVSLLYPHAVATEDGVQLWYTGFDGARFAVGQADCDAEATACTGAGPHLEADPDGWDNAAVAMAEVVVAGGQTHTWYGGYDTVIADPGPWRVGRLEGSRRLVSLPLTESGLEAFSTRDPAVVPWGAGWLMVYVAMGDDGQYRLMSATSDVCSG